MLQTNPQSDDALRALRRLFDRHDVDLAVRAARGPGYLVDPWMRGDTDRVLRATARLPTETRTLITLFLAAARLGAGLVERVVGAELTAALLACGLLRRDDGHLATDSYAVIPRDGLYFLTDCPNGGDRRRFDVYIGPDSYRLLNCLDRSRTGIRALDLGSGTGLLGQSLASLAERVVAVDPNAAAVAVGRANAVLNGVDARWEIRPGDLWEPVAGERFDLVVSNPPYLPVPIEEGYPAYAGAGDDGLLFLRRILAGLRDHLADDGRAQLVFRSAGSAAEPKALPLVRAFAEDHPEWSVKLVLEERRPILAPWRRSFAATVAQMRGEEGEARIAELADAVGRGLQARGLAFNFHALLHIDARPPVPGLKVVAVHNAWHFDAVPRLEKPPTLPEGIDRDLVAAFDGKRTIAEAAREVAARRPEATLESLLARGVDLCRALELSGLLHDPARAAAGALRRMLDG